MEMQSQFLFRSCLQSVLSRYWHRRSKRTIISVSWHLGLPVIRDCPRNLYESHLIALSYVASRNKRSEPSYTASKVVISIITIIRARKRSWFTDNVILLFGQYVRTRSNKGCTVYVYFLSVGAPTPVVFTFSSYPVCILIKQ